MVKYTVKMIVEYEIEAESKEEAQERAELAVMGEESVTWDIIAIDEE